MRPAGERFAGFPPRFAAPALAAAALCFCALFLAGGSDETRLVWIGGAALVLAALTAAGGLLGALPSPRLDRWAAIFLGSLSGLAVWAGLSTLWSASPDRSWTYTNRTLVYAAFALLGALLSALIPRLSVLAGAAAVLLGLVIGWALLAKCVPALYSDYGRVARLRAPVTYWNELALLCDVAVPLALWLAAARGRRAPLRAAGVLLLFASTVTLLLTYSRTGVVLGCLAVAAWVVLDRDRVESLAAVALGGGAGAAVFGLALALPGITKDLQPRAVRAHDGWIFALAARRRRSSSSTASRSCSRGWRAAPAVGRAATSRGTHRGRRRDRGRAGGHRGEHRLLGADLARVHEPGREPDQLDAHALHQSQLEQPLAVVG